MPPDSACQRAALPENPAASCGACCGVFNLDFAAAGSDAGYVGDVGTPTADAIYARRRELLRERTERFVAAVRYDDPLSIRDFRREREAVEESLPRRDAETYVCPFLGSIDLERGPDPDAPRMGCMIHPAFSGDPGSQNFSFYGASICQAYDCRNKDRDRRGRFGRLIARLFPARDDYARLMADTLFFDCLNKIPGLWERLVQAEASSAPELAAFVRLATRRLAVPDSRCVTSFEIPRGGFADLASELLVLLAPDSESEILKETPTGASLTADAGAPTDVGTPTRAARREPVQAILADLDRLLAACELRQAPSIPEVRPAL